MSNAPSERSDHAMAWASNWVISALSGTAW